MYKQFIKLLGITLLSVSITVIIISCGNSGPEVGTSEITSVTPDSGMVGAAITIGTKNVNTQQSECQVSFDGTPAPVRSTKAEEIIAEVPEGASSGPVKLTAGNKTISGPYFKILTQQLVVTGVSPAKAPTGSRITITGANFLGNTPNKSSKKSPTASQKTHGKTALKKKANAGKRSKKLTGSNSSLPNLDNTVNNHHSDNNSRLNNSPAHTNQMKSSSNTTDTLSKSGGQLTISIDGQPAPILSVTDTLILTEVPQNATQGTITITVGDKSVTSDRFEVIPSPKITGLSSKEGPIGSSVTLNGVGFNTTADANIVTFNDTEATISSASSTKVVATVPQDATSGPVKIAAFGQTATGPSFNVTENHSPKFASAQSTYKSKENKTAVETLVAFDPDGDALTYKLNGGTDKGLFSIDSNSGALTFNSAPDFEQPADNDAGNTYEVQVRVSDGNLSISKNLTVSVQNVNEAPVFVSTKISTNTTEYKANLSGGNYVFNDVTTGTNLASIDSFYVAMQSDLDPLQGATISGPDGGIFSVQTVNDYVIKLSGPTLDYNHSANGTDHQYQFSVTAQNGAGQTISQTFIITVDPFTQGSGTQSDPYLVSNLDQLQGVEKYSDAYFKQTADINASGASTWNGGKGFDPIQISGTYNGNGHTITGLTIDRPNIGKVALFSQVSSSGTIKNLHLTNVNVTASTNSGTLAGANYGSITNCSVTGTLDSYQSSAGNYNVGGLVGKNSGTISKSYADVNTSATGNPGSMLGTGGLVGNNTGIINKSYAAGSVSGDNNNGGLVGTNDGDIQNSYATGAVSGTTNNGGLVGYNNDLIESSYAAGSVSGGNSGGLVGYNGGFGSNPVINTSYWDTQSTGQPSAIGNGLTSNNDSTGLTTSQMQGSSAQTNITGFDFTSVWQTNASYYPTLQ
ncbi:hypothetical protein LX73_2574 [Fodinibius salinus]|uniref:Cadherin domain-containing protein n=1 Tax=Fodinibius salinus TaxID=860790 RepID=A0A5D3YJC9_9BACT|nr:IPT/TIG domain-containing protein [Fodinibius salinus]TYP91747.1 hypothetical protein LX73_2574 [Fodinibius salinus]